MYATVLKIRRINTLIIFLNNLHFQKSHQNLVHYDVLIIQCSTIYDNNILQEYCILIKWIDSCYFKIVKLSHIIPHVNINQYHHNDLI